jgi:hypothetical protein
VSDNTPQVDGSVDRDAQRAAWSIDAKEATTFDAGLNNLTHAPTTVLVRYGKERTQPMVLVRLEEPKGGMKERVSVRQAGSVAGHQPPQRSFP